MLTKQKNNLQQEGLKVYLEATCRDKAVPCLSFASYLTSVYHCTNYVHTV